MDATDLGTVRQWLQDPRVSDWWGGPDYIENITKSMVKAWVDQWIVETDGSALAYLQDYAVHGFDTHPFAALPKGARGLDTFLGSEAWMGQGFGPRFLTQHVEALFAQGVPALGIDPHPENSAAIRAYQKIGFHGHHTMTAPYGDILRMYLWRHEFREAQPLDARSR